MPTHSDLAILVTYPLHMHNYAHGGNECGARMVHFARMQLIDQNISSVSCLILQSSPGSRLLHYFHVRAGT